MAARSLPLVLFLIWGIAACDDGGRGELDVRLGELRAAGVLAEDDAGAKETIALRCAREASETAFDEVFAWVQDEGLDWRSPPVGIDELLRGEPADGPRAWATRLHGVDERVEAWAEAARRVLTVAGGRPATEEEPSFLELRFVTDWLCVRVLLAEDDGECVAYLGAAFDGVASRDDGGAMSSVLTSAARSIVFAAAHGAIEQGRDPRVIAAELVPRLDVLLDPEASLERRRALVCREAKFAAEHALGSGEHEDGCPPSCRWRSVPEERPVRAFLDRLADGERILALATLEPDRYLAARAELPTDEFGGLLSWAGPVVSALDGCHFDLARAALLRARLELEVGRTQGGWTRRLPDLPLDPHAGRPFALAVRPDGTLRLGPAAILGAPPWEPGPPGPWELELRP